LANAGATDTGGIDPLEELADVAEAQGLWLHVDGAYGGAFALCDEGRRRLVGMSRADSVTLDPHKGLFLPFGSGALLIRDAATLYAANHARAAYMRDLDEQQVLADASACDFSPELTRPLRGLRLWLPLKLFGIAPFRAALEEKLLLAAYAYEAMQDIPHIELGPEPDLSIYTFRFTPPEGNTNEFNNRFATALRDHGRVYLSSTVLDGDVWMRMAILNYHSHLVHVDDAIAAIRDVSAALLLGR
jgi:glutamate/tyrosine decarboxylase-like PLP-dependent enzyme